MNNDFYSAVISRRSIYGISSESVVSDERIIEIVQQAVKYAPSAFNSQSSRAVVLLAVQHEKLWDLTKEALHKIVPPDAFAQTEEKIDSFRAGYGTILFFEEQTTITNLQEKFALYKDNFPVWSQQASGMLQYIVWTSLELEGLGVTLQHYNPLIDAAVKDEWQLPDSWKLIAQMPFGKPIAPPNEKTFLAVDERVKVYK